MRYIVIADAINYSKLTDNLPINSFGNYILHANPLILYPPIPYSHASETHISVGSVNMMLFISTPFFDVRCSKSIQNLKSAFTACDIFLLTELFTSLEEMSELV